MAKIFDSAPDIVELFENKFEEVGLSGYGVNLKVLSTVKSKDLVKVSKASATLEHLTRENDLVTLVVFEEAFDRLTDIAKNIFVEMAISCISFDFEKEKLSIDTSQFNQAIRVRKKYSDEEILNAIELSNHVIIEIEEEAKAKKEAEREAKKAAKSHS